MFIITAVEMVMVPDHNGVFFLRNDPDEIDLFNPIDELSQQHIDGEVIKGRRFVDPKSAIDLYIGYTKDAGKSIGPIFEAYDRIQKENNELRETNREILDELIRTTKLLEKAPNSQYLRNLHVIEKATGKTWAELQAPRILPVEKIRGILGGSGKEAGEVKVDKRWYSEETMTAVVKERDELKDINREMLHQLIMIGTYGALRYDSDWPKLQYVIEKATGKTWAEIKEAGE